jgi:tetratricopeptide (TPR) repeat protein
VWGLLGPQDQEQLTADELATREILQSEAGRTPDAYELAAVYLLLRGDSSGALQTLRESTQHDPASSERWEAYIGVLTQTADLAAVQAAIEQALQQVDNGTLRCALAKVHQKRGELPEAEAQLEAAIALNDDRATFARVMLGVLRLKAGDAAGAVAPLQVAAADWREDGLCEAALGIALALSGQEAEAPAHVAKAVKLSPNDRLFAHAAGIIGP